MAIICRICSKSVESECILDLGDQTIGSSFCPLDQSEKIPKVPLCLVRCEECGLMQLTDTVDSDSVYKSSNYGYRSGLNKQMVTHLYGIVDHCLKYNLSKNRTIVDIGSNDGTTLNRFIDKGYKNTVGVDPTASQFIGYYNPQTKIIPDYYTADSISKVIDTSSIGIITSICMLYDLPDPVSFFKQISAVLPIDAIWVTEQSYAPTMLERMAYDTICHEHLEYYTLRDIKHMASLSGLKIIDCEFNDSNGGSFRVTLSKLESDYKECQLPENFESEEYINGLIGKFKTEVPKLKEELLRVLKFLSKVSIWGASTKGNTILQYCGIDSNMIANAGECNKEKVGKVTPGSNIQIVDEETAIKSGNLLVLPWHFRYNFVDRFASEHPECKLIFPLPKVEVVSFYNRKRAVVLGSSGQIGSYVTSYLKSLSYDLLLISNREESVDLRKILDFKPDEIYNFAGQSDRNTKGTTMDDNYSLVSELLDLIDGTDIKLIQANSILIFDSSNKTVVDDQEADNLSDLDYVLSKKMAYDACSKSSRSNKVYTLILSNVESKLRKESFIIPKIIKSIRSGESLVLDNKHAQKDWIHASDVARLSVHLLNDGFEPGSYLVASGELNPLSTIIDLISKKLHKTSEHILDLEKKESVTEYKSTKIFSKGFKFTYNIESIVDDYLSE